MPAIPLEPACGQDGDEPINNGLGEASDWFLTDLQGWCAAVARKTQTGDGCLWCATSSTQDVDYRQMLPLQ